MKVAQMLSDHVDMSSQLTLRGDINTTAGGNQINFNDNSLYQTY